MMPSSQSPKAQEGMKSESLGRDERFMSFPFAV